MPILVYHSATGWIPLKLFKCYLHIKGAHEACNSVRWYVTLSSENSITHLAFSSTFRSDWGVELCSHDNTRISFRRYGDWIAFYSIKASLGPQRDLWSIGIKRGLGYVYLGNCHQLLLKQRGVRHKWGLVFLCELYFYAIFLADISYRGVTHEENCTVIIVIFCPVDVGITNY